MSRRFAYAIDKRYLPDPACWPGRRLLAPCRLLPDPLSLTGARQVVLPVLRRVLVTAHVLQASGTTQPATAIRMTLTTTPASSSPDAGQ
jgi:hypothetical protein